MAVDVAVAVAHEHGLSANRPEVLHEGSSVIVRLASGGLVACVGGLIASVRDVAAHYGRDVDITRWLVAAGHPWSRPGIGRARLREGQIVTFWHEARTTSPSAGELAGEALRRGHQALRHYDGELPPLGAPARGCHAPLRSSGRRQLGQERSRAERRRRCFAGRSERRP